MKKKQWLFIVLLAACIMMQAACFIPNTSSPETLKTLIPKTVDDENTINTFNETNSSNVVDIISPTPTPSIDLTKALTPTLNINITEVLTPTPMPTPTPTPTAVPELTPTDVPATPTNTPTPIPTTGTYMPAMAQEVFTLVNIERDNVGVPTLSWSNELESSANIRSSEIVILFSHTRPNGDPWFTAQPQWQMAENIAKKYSSPSSVVNAWMGSDAHRTTMLSTEYSHIGVSCYQITNSEGDYECYWVQHFF